MNETGSGNEGKLGDMTSAGCAGQGRSRTIAGMFANSKLLFFFLKIYLYI